MKPKSIIFLILAGVILLSGVILCIVGSSMASSAGIPIINDSIDKKGNEITKYELDEYDLTSFRIDMEEVDVNIIGSNKSSYVEFVNVNPANYEYSIKNGKMDINTVSPFKVSAFIKISENGSGFSGLRSYLHLNRYEDKKSAVNIYISEEILSSVTVSLDKGDLKIEKMTADCSYDISVSKGDVSIKNTKTANTTDIRVNGGELVCDILASDEITAEVKKGGATFYCDRKYSIDAEAKSGSVYFSDENMGDAVIENYPDIKKMEIVGKDEAGKDIEKPADIKNIKVSVDGGDIMVLEKTVE